MDELKETIAKNLVQLRTEARLTQLQLAEMLNYSDKAVSKWERGDAIPDLRVLIKLANIYNITVDDIISSSAHERMVKPKMNTGKKRALIIALSVGLCWFVATVLFMIFFFIHKPIITHTLRSHSRHLQARSCLPCFQQSGVIGGRICLPARLCYGRRF